MLSFGLSRRSNISLADLQRHVADDPDIVLANILATSQLIESKHEVFELGMSTQEKYTEDSARLPNYDRLDDNHAAMAGQRTAHFFRFSYFFRHQKRIFEIIKPRNDLRNSIADLPTGFSFFEEKEYCVETGGAPLPIWRWLYAYSHPYYRSSKGRHGMHA